MDQFAAPEPFALYADRLAESPDLVRWDKEVSRSDATIALEKSQRIPDVTVSLGGSRFEVDDGKAVRFGVSVPLPLFDRNQGNVIASQARRQLTANQRQQALLSLQVKLNESYTRMASAFQNAQTLRDGILPAAAEAYETILTSYQAGRLSFLDLVQAQRTLLDVREQYLDTLESYHLNRAELERFVARQGE
jgi:cobalt-zinc-cadmium efflux system outer membrane protein